MLQETLDLSSEVVSSLGSTLPGWHFQALDSSGHSGGLVTGFREGRMKLINQWGMNNVLGIEVATSKFDIPLLILNIYGPCQERVSFWNNLLAKAVTKNQNLVIGGDLNFSIGIAEAWGPLAKEDPLSDFFLNAFSSHNLIKANMIKLKPAWRNHRTGEARLAKRLDRFFLSEDLASKIPVFRQWVGGGEFVSFPNFTRTS